MTMTICPGHINEAREAERQRWKAATFGLEEGTASLRRVFDLLENSNLSAEQIRAQIVFDVPALQSLSGN
jgi:hypothetical protein